jgi:hypothetical protein
MGATNRLDAGFRQPEVFDLAFLNQTLHRSRHVLDRHVRVDAVLIEQVDRLDLETPERSLGDLFDVGWPAIQTALLPSFEREPELGRDHHMVTLRSERFAHELFVDERAIRFGRIEERNAALGGRSNQGDHLLLLGRRTIAKAHRHAARPEGGHFQVTVSERSRLHRALSFAA